MKGGGGGEVKKKEGKNGIRIEEEKEEEENFRRIGDEMLGVRVFRCLVLYNWQRGEEGGEKEGRLKGDEEAKREGEGVFNSPKLMNKLQLQMEKEDSFLFERVGEGVFVIKGLVLGYKKRKKIGQNWNETLAADRSREICA